MTVGLWLHIYDYFNSTKNGLFVKAAIEKLYFEQIFFSHIINVGIKSFSKWISVGVCRIKMKRKNNTSCEVAKLNGEYTTNR